MRDSGRWRIRVEGTVQGVGFRPFVYRTALELRLAGFVRNTSDGVVIEAQGPADALSRFVDRITRDPPPLARIESLLHEPIAPIAEADAAFRIAASAAGTEATAQISPDIAPCSDCLAELADPRDRRHRYPFINCTNCGPRYTIVEALPYDRPQTTMRGFAMCSACSAEYADPRDRRFHAQPDACAACGPKLTFRRTAGAPGTAPSSNPLHDALTALDAGAVVAVKGVGGFHLACDATNGAAVALLRQRKRRDEKPFAVMVGALDAAHQLCRISDTEAKLLTSPQRPIVLLRTKPGAALSPLVAPGNRNLGLMLPSTPLHHLLFDRPGARALVMTSGNVSDEPIAFENDEALARLDGIADAFLLHDRPIRTRVDDSIVRAAPRSPLVIRRARGFVPEPVRLPFETPPILAAGADLKGAVCFTRGRSAFLSQHLGDLSGTLAHRAFEDAIGHLGHLLDLQPSAVAHDLHPDYFSTRCAAALAHERRLPTAAVQHHHAHIAACMAENGLPDEDVIGIALDGAGMGPDGTIWGGEILGARYSGFVRLARFRPVPLPGGDAAAREPWRMALAWLDAPHSFDSVDPARVRGVLEMIAKGINAPQTSSCGRLFDAAAALAGVRLVNTFEGQAAMELEQIAEENENGVYAVAIDDDATPMELDFRPTVAALAAEASIGIAPSLVSARFHNTLVEALVRACRALRSSPRLALQSAPVCCSGGCFQNALLSERLEKRLVAEGFAVYTHSLVPANDGGIALGQAAVAAHQMRTP